MNLATIAHYFPLLVGIAALLIGAMAVAKPKAMSEKFGVIAEGQALPYVVSTGIRDVFIGLIVLILFYLEQWAAIGAAHFCIGLVAISDFLVVRKHGNKKVSLVHLIGAIVATVYGIWLFSALRA